MTSFRPPQQVDLATLLQQQNPRINLRLESYEHTTSDFMKAIVGYKNHAITIMSNRSSAASNDRKRVVDKVKAGEAEINQCKLKEIDLLASKLDPSQTTFLFLLSSHSA